MSDLITQEQMEMLLFLLKGDKWALKFVLDVVFISQVWDDCVDEGKEDWDSDKINDAFVKAFRTLPVNPFYVNLHPVYQQQLNGLIMSAAASYRDSTQMEMGDDADRFMAFYLRNNLLNIIHY